MKKILIITFSILAFSWSSIISAAEDVKVGVLYPLTGPVAQVGKDAVAAVKTALDLINNSHDIAKILGQVLSKLGPYIVLAFFAAQFIATFNYSGLGHVLAITGGGFLKGLEIENSLLLSCFILMAVFINLFIGSSSAKYAFFAPVFVPMLMQIGISPELTQVSYRIGDSVSNVITPMNPYMIIILMEVKKYVRGSGLGTVIAMMLPYTISFLIAWLLLLLFWVEMSWPLGPGGALVYQL